MRTAHLPAVTELGRADAVPRMPQRVARALSRLYRHRQPLPLSFARHSGLLRWQLPARNAVPVENFEIYGFRLGRFTGQLGLDSPTLAMLLNERRAALLPRELRQVLIADALGTPVHALEQATRQRFEWTLAEASETGAAPAGRFDPMKAAHFTLDIGDTTDSNAQSRCAGFLQFDDDTALDTLTDSLCGPGLPGPEIEWLEMPLSFELGRTPIRLHEISGICHGDIIGIEAWQSVGTTISARLVLGGHLTSLTALLADTHITLQPWKEFSMSTTGTPQAAANEVKETIGLPLGRLDGMEVALRFEVGDVSVSLRELRSIRPGHVFELPQPLDNSTVRIYAHGNMLGTGHLVAVGDRLGVRVVEFAPDAHDR